MLGDYSGSLWDTDDGDLMLGLPCGSGELIGDMVDVGVYKCLLRED